MPVNTPHSDYMAMLPTWIAWRDAYAGSRAVKGRSTSYLAQPAGMKRAKQYAAYLSRAIWYGATERAVHGMAGMVFRHAPQILAPDILASAQADITLSGVPLVTLAEQVFRETLLMGRAGILVDFPRVDGMPQQAGQISTVIPTAAARPYWVAYQAEEVLNWRTMQRQGDTVLSLVVLKESLQELAGAYPDDTFFAPVFVTQYRVLRLNEQGVYEVSVWREASGQGRLRRAQTTTAVLQDTWIPTRQGEPLTSIPFLFVAPFQVGPAIDKSFLDALIDTDYRYYRHSADYEHGLHLTALPTPCVIGHEPDGTEFVIGSQVAWVIPNPNAKVEMLEFHGAGLTPHEHALEKDVQDMAAKGARLLEGQAQVSETATAVRSRTQGSESPVQSLVGMVNYSLTQALQLHAWWVGATDNPQDPAVIVKLNTDLVVAPMTPEMLREWVGAWLSGAASFQTLYYNLQRGEQTRPGIDAETEQALIDVQVATRNGVGAFGGGL